MSCINPKQPIFQKILGLTNNPLKSEFIYDDMMDIIGKESLYNSYGDKLSNAIAEDIMLESPAMKRESPNVYSIHLVQDSNKINTLEQAYEVAKERASKINTKYSKGIRDIARVTTEKGDIRVIIEPNKQHVSDYIIKELIKGEEDKKSEGYANISNNEVKYIIKAVEILQSDKAKQIFDKGYKNNWSIDKILIELAIPKEQRELINSIIASLYKKETLSSNLPDWRNDIIVDLITNYSYTVEINTAKTQYKQYNIEPEPGIPYEVTNRGDIEEGENTSYYSNLTVPGGTNYTENEISTPLITPSIKGHAQFSTDNGIGWFRSDDKGSNQNLRNDVVDGELEFERPNDNIYYFHIGDTLYINDNVNKVYTKNNNEISKEEWIKAGNQLRAKPVITKTRRILEVQSDLFQKSRDKEFLVDNYKHTPGDRNFNVTYEGKEYKVGTMGGMQRVVIYKTLEGQVHYENPKQDWLTQEEIPQGLKDIVSNKFNSLKQEVLTQNKSNKENQFLQLLNKDNNWVTFFIKSIIQDSAKKGYEKVLFPSGETAAKVEVHETLANELIRIDKEIQQLKKDNIHYTKIIDGTFKNIDEIKNDETGTINTLKNSGEFYTFNEIVVQALQFRKQRLDKIQQYEQRKSALKSQSIEKIKPIEAFYEIQVTNILKKTYGKVQDYSNTPIKTGVDNLFEENKELSKIGNKQLYSAYLDTIFPDSQVKDIVYHGGKTNKDSFKSFVDKTKYKDRNPNSILGFFFSSSRNTVAGQYAEKDYDAIQEQLTGDAETDAFIRRNAPLKKGSVSEELLNIKNPYIIQAEEWENETWVDKLNILTEKDKDDDWVSDYKWTVNAYEKVKNYLQSLGYDGLYINSNKELFNKTGIVDYITVQKVVFEPEQIHILGSKQDIEEFKGFLKENSKPKVPQITDEYGNTWNEVTIDQTRDISNILFQIKAPNTVSKKNELISKLNTNLQDYIKANNIKVEFYDSLKNTIGDPVAVFDSINKVIKINTGKADIDTLPEELAHHLTLALGNDYLLVKRALNLIGRLDYKNLLGEEYVELYNNDTNLLKHEYLGKLIAKRIASSVIPTELDNENGNKLWDTIKNLIDRFIALFKPNSNIEAELDKTVSELSNMITTGVKINSEGNYNPYKMFQLDNKKDVPKEYKDQYVYYKHNLKALKALNRKLQSEITDANKERKLAEINYNTEKIATITNSLNELLESGNKQLLINLASNTLDEIEQYINKLANVKKAGNIPSYDNIENTIKTLHILENLSGVKDRVASLQKDIKPYVKEFVIQHVNKYSTNKIDSIDLDKKEKDIFVGEGNFGTLSDVNNYLAKTIGFTIKEAQAAIERDNKKSFNELEKELDALEKYTDSKGISKEDRFKVFIQEYKGTTVLTKEYTTEFYNEIQKSFDMEEEAGKAYRKSIASYDYENKKFIPKDKKYKNPNYEKIKETPELKKFYSYFQSTIKSLTEQLPINLSDNFIPNLVEQGLMDILKSDSSVGEKLKEGVMNMMDIYDLDDSESAFVKDEHLFNDTIPLKHVAKISPDKKSSDLGTALLKFMYFSNSYKHMSEILPKTRLLQEIIKEQSFLKNSNTNIAIKGEETNLYKMTEAFINMQIKGEMKREEKYAPYIDFGLKYTSLLRIGLNPFNALTNVFIGNIGNVVESIGGRHFTYRQYNSARKIFFEQVFTEGSKLNKLIELYNPLMELDDYENLNRINIGSSEYKDKVQSIMYLPQRVGEKLLQTSTMIASLLHDKVTTKDGKEVSIWEAFNDKGEWNKELMGYELTETDIFKTTNKVQRINQMIHGRYSQKDATALSQYSLFRAAFQFKKWIPAAIEMRLGEKRFDDRLGVEVEGRYHTYVKGVRNILARLQKDVDKIEQYKFTETDIYNMKKNLTELAIMFSSMLMYVGLGWDDDKKKQTNGWYKFTMSQLNRVSDDLLYWYNPSAMADTGMNALPILKTTKDMITVIKNIPYAFGMEDTLWLDKHAEYQKGRKKGENKFVSSLIDVTPVVKPFVDIARTWNDEPYQEPRKK